MNDVPILAELTGKLGMRLRLTQTTLVAEKVYLETPGKESLARGTYSLPVRTVVSHGVGRGIPFLGVPYQVSFQSGQTISIGMFGKQKVAEAQAFDAVLSRILEQ